MIYHTKKMKMSIKDFLVPFTEKIRNGKLHFLYSGTFYERILRIQEIIVQ